METPGHYHHGQTGPSGAENLDEPLFTSVVSFHLHVFYDIFKRA